MSQIKRDRNTSMISNNRRSSSPRQAHNGLKTNGRQISTSSPVHHSNSPDSQQHYYGKKEKGIVEKLLNSYGFVECATTGNRVFFHYSEYEGDPNQFQVGDCLDFVLTTDPRNNKPIAINLCKLPPGSVVIETLSEETCTGRIEVEAKPLRNGELSDPSTLGRVSYDKSGEFFFLPFSINDIAKGEQIKKGDNVEFFIATNKRTGSLKARKIKFLDPTKQIRTVQGIVSSLKEAYGFIERSDIVAEIFFHYTEYSGDVNELMIGDDVQFNLQDRLGKEIAVAVKKLPPGSVVFEDISETRYKGHVIKSVGPKSMNNSMDGQLTGMIEYQGKTDTHEVLFGDRDMEDDIILQKGDVIEFNVSTDRRDKLQRAVNIKLISVCLKNGQVREVGVISSLKDGFGFIKCAEQELSIFFHFSEVLEQSHITNIGDEVEFTIENDHISQRQHATRIRFLPKGTVTFETISSKRHVGVIEREAPERTIKSPSKQNRDNEYGIIKCFLEGQETDILYRVRDCRPRELVRYRDKVEFVLVTKRTNQQKYARDVSVLEKSDTKLLNGYICALKDSYGFIETESHATELFFHFSEYEGDCRQLELGDCVLYAETKKGEKRSAEKVCRILSHVCKDEILPMTYDGTITRPMRTMDPEQEEYEGLVYMSSSSKTNGTSADDDEKLPTNTSDESDVDNQVVYRFGITSILEKKEALQTGDKVSFQLCVDAVTKKKRACNIACKRSLIKGKVESIKGQFGFIYYESEDGKSVFFHMSEVQKSPGKELKVGDDVTFILVKNHKNAKKSAVRVQKVIDERPEHLSRRRSQRFSECQTPKFTIVRQPSGPDGTSGFALKRSSSNDLDTAVVSKEEEVKISSGVVLDNELTNMESTIEEQVAAMVVTQ